MHLHRPARPAAVAALGALILTSTALGTGIPAAQATPADDCTAPDVTLTAAATGNSAISVQPGQVVALTGGTFAGGIDQLPAGGTLCVTAGTTLDPAYLNNAQGAIAVAAGGTLDAPNQVVAAGFELDNAGTATFAGLGINGNATLNNRSGATLTIRSGFAPAAGTVINAGTMVVQGDATLNDQVALTNENELHVQGSLTANGHLGNSGLLRVDRDIVLNGSGTLSNTCGIQAGGDLRNDATGSSNTGLLLVGGTFSNNGSWSQPHAGTLSAADLIDDGTLTGFGSYRFTGGTSVQGTFAGDSAADPIVVDTGQDPPFPGQTGQIANVVAGTVDPGTIEDHPSPGCAAPVDRTSADIRVTKTGLAQVLTGASVTYTLTVENEGPDLATGVVLTDTLPAELTDVTVSDAGTVSGGVATWAIGDLAAGAGVTRTVTGTAPAAVATLTDTASATSTSPDPAPSNNDGSTAAQQVVTEVVTTDPGQLPGPTAANVDRQTLAGVPVLGVGAGNSPDGLRLTYERLSDPTHGGARMSGAGAFGYLPDSGFAGIDSFTYRVCDSQTPAQCSAPATITITVLPRALNDEATTRRSHPVTVPVSANDTTGAQLTRIVSWPHHGGVTGLDPAEGTLTYDPGGYLGDDELVYETCSVTDPGVCAQATVVLHVIPDNDPPVTDLTVLTTTVDTAVSGALEVSDPNGDAVAVGEVFGPVYGSESTAQLSTTYQPRPGFAGVDLYAYTACDDGYPQLCSTGLVRGLVDPVATDDTASTAAGSPVPVDVRANDLGEVDPPALVADPAHGTATWDGSRFVYSPADGFSGTDSFRYRICAADGSGLCADATVTVTVADPGGTPGEPGTPGDPGDPGTAGTGPGAGSTGGGPALAITGAAVGGGLLLGLGLLALGAGLHRAGRRRSA
ncbi:Ig-like domain-containing protein [Cellulomonas denverensis]|uniref:Ig-like domain-containing protein n=1 Tax=Cellulomonas denverensis TaxID=264297 RepID=UPI0035ECCAA4